MSTTTTAENTVRLLEDAWNAADGEAFGAPFAEDADFVNVRGELHSGRRAIAAGHQGIFDSIYAGSTVRYRVLQARELDHGSILAHVDAQLSVPGGPLAGDHQALASVLLVENGDGHAIAAFHNTLVAAG
ncbi:MAG TPA: SgcJ/EcaC family oxidoreductase [Thermoleophilaceae bacterium]|nr:SgcJ/EcaC family oxidoreductase [Thermoleophilaceae bacterium]